MVCIGGLVAPAISGAPGAGEAMGSYTGAGDPGAGDAGAGDSGALGTWVTCGCGYGGWGGFWSVGWSWNDEIGGF